MHKSFAGIGYFAVIVTCITWCLFVNRALAEEVRIGVRANRGAELAMKRWQPTADYLSQKIPGHTFAILPFEINSLLNQAVSRGEFQFVLTNPASHVEQNIRYGVTPIASLINKRNGDAYSQFGTVIFTLADRNDITSFQDLIGKKFMGADELGFGGWRVAYLELLKKGIDPYKDFELLSFAGGIQHDVVYAVRDGEVDAGSVRTGMLEKMAQEGWIQLEEFKVLEPRKTEGFGFSHSSRLYPEWPLAKLASTSDELAHQVKKALYAITPDSEVAKAGKYYGWSAPLDYEPVNALLKELAIGPYTASGKVTFKRIVRAYWAHALLLLGGLIIVAIITLWVLLSNRRLKKVTQQLNDYQDQLEDMVAMRTAELAASNRELESYSYSIAHDLRGPLRSLVGFSQILEHEAGKKLNEEELDTIERIVRSGKQMAETIDDILALSRINRGAVSKEMVDMSAICHELAQQLSEQNQSREVSWTIGDDLKSSGDRSLLRVMLQNILENAWKFTRDVANPHIVIGQKIVDGVNTFYVRDNGIGFDMQYVDKIYQPFHRLHRDEFEGTGIGLAIVQRVVERHGGRLWADSRPGKGTTFYFTLTPDKASDE